MKELSTEEMNAVRGGQDTNIAASTLNTAAAANVALVSSTQTNANAFSVLTAQENELKVRQNAEANAGNIFQANA
jgi:hypothetical protein